MSEDSAAGEVESLGTECVDCDRCGEEIGPLQPVTNIQFSGGVDGLRTACNDCVQEIVEVWNQGDAV